jgi:hypothetical protein
LLQAGLRSLLLAALALALGSAGDFDGIVATVGGVSGGHLSQRRDEVDHGRRRRASMR